MENKNYKKTNIEIETEIIKNLKDLKLKNGYSYKYLINKLLNIGIKQITK